MSSSPAATLTGPDAAAATSAAAVETVLSVEGVGKYYEIYSKPFDRLKQTLWRGRRQFFREFWALRDVSFSVSKGEAVGVVGRNGSGKSTLLQIIAGTLRPTQGSVTVRGRVHALLELGSGFNPDFSGRENVFLNGSILGLTQAQIAARFDEIAGFADIGDFLDQAVKTYSTGMFMRLAFAVQVVLEPELLIVDEALAVGDAAFQMKCYQRMRRMIDDGLSVLLVAHDTQTIRSFCHRALWLDGGRLKTIGKPVDVTSAYVQDLFRERSGARAAPAGAGKAAVSVAGSDQKALSSQRELLDFSERQGLTRWGTGELRVVGAALDAGVPTNEPVFNHGDRIHVEFCVAATVDIESTEIGFGIAIRDRRGLHVIVSTTYERGKRFGPLRAGQQVRLSFEFPNILAPAEYALVLNAEDRGGADIHYYDFIENAFLFRVVATHQIFSLVLPQVDQYSTVIDPPAGAA